MSDFDFNNDNQVKILVPVDSDIESGRAAQAFAAALNLKPDILTLLHVYEPVPMTVGGDEHRALIDERNKRASDVLERARQIAGSSIKVETMILEGQVVESIVRAAHESAADIILMVTDGRHAAWVNNRACFAFHRYEHSGFASQEKNETRVCLLRILWH